jgi:hypothetical protein
MIIMPQRLTLIILQLTGQADFWHPTVSAWEPVFATGIVLPQTEPTSAHALSRRACQKKGAPRAERMITNHL